MPDQKSRTVVEAHKLRAMAARAMLLHGSRRTTRELGRATTALVVASIVAGAALMVAVFAATKVTGLF